MQTLKGSAIPSSLCIYIRHKGDRKSMHHVITNSQSGMQFRWQIRGRYTNGLTLPYAKKYDVLHYLTLFDGLQVASLG
jgi:hypothetical protein